MDAKKFYAQKASIISAAIGDLDVALGRIEVLVEFEQREAACADTTDLDQLHSDLNTTRNNLEQLLAAVSALV